jgi:soluble lytic murein transglycosylase-like protein
MAQTDRFYNAPEGPQTQPVVESPRRARFELSTSPDMFGGLIAKGLTELGAGAKDAYNTFGQIAADQASNNFLGELGNLRSGLENTRGQATMDSYRGSEGQPGFQEQAQKLFDDYRQQVPPGFQSNFDQVGRRYLFSTNNWAQSHFAQQSQAWAQGVAKDKENGAIANISAHPMDDGLFNNAMQDMGGAAVKQMQISSGITDLTDANPEGKARLTEARDQAIARAWYARIEAVRTSNPDQAVKWAHDNADVLGKLGPEANAQLRAYESQQDIHSSVDGELAKAGAGAGGQAAKPEVSPASSPSFTGASPPVKTALIGAGVAGVSVPRQYAPIVQTSSQKWGVDPVLLSRQLSQESGYRDATSPAGAQGIGQFMPGTAARYGVNVHDAQSSIDGAAHYMHDLMGMFGGNKGLALAGYNWGEGNVQKWLQAGGNPAHMPKETQNYVQSITGHPVSEWLTNPGVPIRTTPLGVGQTPGSAAPLELPAAPPFEAQPGIAPTPAATAGAPAAIEGTPAVPGAVAQAEGGGEQPQPAAFGTGGAPPVGGSLGPAPVAPQGGTEVAPDQQSVWDIERDRLSTGMINTINNPEYSETKKQGMLKEFTERMRYAEIAAEQDGRTRARHSSEAIDRSLKMAMNGDAAAGYRSLDDAFKRGVIDEPAYDRGTAVIEKRSGQPDTRAMGEGWLNVVKGIRDNGIRTYDDLLDLEIGHQLTERGVDEANRILTLHQQRKYQGIEVKSEAVLKRANDWFKWEIPGPTPGTSIANPKGSQMFQDFLSKYYDDMDAFRKDDPDLRKFDYFDGKKLTDILSQQYPDRERADAQKNTGLSNLTQDQASAEDAQWASLIAAHPPPHGTSPAAWLSTVASPPQTKQGFPLPRIEWDGYLRTLAADPTPFARQSFDKHFGPDGDIAKGAPADELLRWLAPSPARPHEEEGKAQGRPVQTIPLARPDLSGLPGQAPLIPGAGAFSQPAPYSPSDFPAQ